LERQVYCVEGPGAVYCVLTFGVRELLDGLNRMVEQHLLPSTQLKINPIVIDPFDTGNAVLGDFFE